MLVIRRWEMGEEGGFEHLLCSCWVLNSWGFCFRAYMLRTVLCSKFMSSSKFQKFAIDMLKV